MTQIEEHEPTGNPDVDRAFRKQLQIRYGDLAIEYETKTAQLEKVTARSPDLQDDPTILDHLPVIEAAHLTDVPEELLRGLYESFNLELRYRASDHTATIRGRPTRRHPNRHRPSHHNPQQHGQRHIRRPQPYGNQIGHPCL